MAGKDIPISAVPASSGKANTGSSVSAPSNLKSRPSQPSGSSYPGGKTRPKSSSAPRKSTHGYTQDDDDEREEQQEQGHERKDQSVLDIVTGGPAQEPSALQQAVGNVTGGSPFTTKTGINLGPGIDFSGVNPVRGLEDDAYNSAAAAYQHAEEAHQAAKGNLNQIMGTNPGGPDYTRALEEARANERNARQQADEAKVRMEKAGEPIQQRARGDYEQANKDYEAATKIMRQIEGNQPDGVDLSKIPGYADAEAAARAARQRMEAAEATFKNAGGKTDWSRLLANRLETGVTGIANSFAGAMDFLFGDFIDEGRALADVTMRDLTGGQHGLNLDQGNYFERYGDYARQHMGELGEEQNVGVGDTFAGGVDKYMPTVIQAIPQAVMAVMSAGSSAAGQMTSQGLQQTALLANSGNAAQTIIPATRAFANQMKDPDWVMSFASTVGGDYETALAEGATPAQAAVYALVNSGMNATIEVGGADEALGGLQELPDQWQQAIASGDKNRLLQLAKSSVGEIGEEIEQGIVSEANKGMYRDTQLYGEGGIIDPERMQDEAMGAAITSAILGGGQMAAVDVQNRLAQNAQNQQQAQTPQTTGIPALDVIQNGEVQRTAPEAQAQAPEVETPAAENPQAPAPAVEQPAPAPAPVAEEAPAPVTEQAVETEQPAPQTPQTVQQTSGTDERGYTGPLVDTQDRVFETNLTEEEKQIEGLTPEEAMHIRHSDVEVDKRAKARLENVELARTELLNAESWTDEDTATAGYLIQQELAAADNAQTETERTEIYKRLAELKKQWNKQGTEEGRALRQRSRFVSEDMVATAADILYGKEKNSTDQKALRKLSPQAKDGIMRNVRQFANQYNNIQKNGGNVNDVIALIKAVSEARRTTGLFSRQNGRAVNWALEKVAQQEGGAEFLNDLLTTQIKSIASDYIRPGFIDQLKSWRFMAMLSNPATTGANTGSNFIFGSFMESMANNFALPFDILMSQITGQREVAGELGAFSPTKWKGSAEDGLRSFLEVTLDAETEQASYGYKELKGGTFKMVGNPIERLLATMQKYQGYGLKTTDQMAKGGTRAQVKEGLGRLAEQGKAKAENIAEIAEKNAEYRTLQSKSKIAETTNKVRGAIDEAVHIGNEKTGTFGLGSALMPFAQVPANAVKASINALPVVSAVDALYKTAKTISDARNGTLQPGQQMEAAKAWGRAANGAVLVAAMAAAAAKGLLRDGSDDDKDVNAQRRAEGTSGTQFNVSAFLRMVSGQGAEPDPDDYWIDFSWCPPINALATFSTDLYDAYARDEDWRDLRNEIPGATYDALTSSFMDFPAVSMISSLINTYKNSDKEGFGKWIETGVTGAAQIASGIAVPNVVRATATGLDPYERDVYNTDTYTQGLWNNLISGIPGARENLPVKLDNFGNPVMNEGGALNFIDRTFIPGSVRQHNKQGEASKVIQGIIEETGDSSIMPNRNAPYKVSFSPGGERVETTAAEREAFKKTAGNIVDEMTQEAAAKGAFENASPEDQRDIIAQFEALAKDRATAEVAKGRGEDYTSTFQELLDGDDDTPALEEENLGDYILFSSLSKNAAKAGKESGDYSGLQSAFGNFFDLDENTQEVIASKGGDMGFYAKAVIGKGEEGDDDFVPPLEVGNIPEFAGFYNGTKDAIKGGDMDEVAGWFGNFDNLSDNTRAVLSNAGGDLGRYVGYMNGTDNPNINKDIPALRPENLPEFENVRDALTAKDPDYATIDAAVDSWDSLDPNTQAVLWGKNEGNLKNLLFAKDAFGMDSETFYGIKNLLTDEQREALEGKTAGVADAIVISRNVKGGDRQKLNALEAMNTPDAETGKRSSIVRRYDAAMHSGLSFDKWTKIEAYISDNSSSSNPSNKTLKAAAEEFGLPYNQVYQIYRKDSEDPEKIRVTNNYFTRRYVAPIKPDYSAYLNGGVFDVVLGNSGKAKGTSNWSSKANRK